ncbi:MULTISPECIES: serine hydrolase [unclassified Duganella]|uniref:serine hydrolase domain-containing protein n=1 Tax=unclassified Duganella TaxID=2636909 RepID=UPI0013147A7C|nr:MULTISPECIES: serine hydrolase domain-containing protein [unclassified Duganella]
MKREMQALMGMLLMAGVSGGGMAATLDQELVAIAADQAMPLASLSVLAVRGGKVQYQYQTGQRRIGPAAAPANADTMYRIASISKMMTTFGVMRLIEQHQLELDTDVSRYLGYALRNPHFPEQAITLRMLLTHTSSLRDEAGYFWGADVAIRDRLTSGAAGMWAGDHGPGGYFTYTNLNWGVIGTIMEKVSGERFDRLMKRLLSACCWSRWACTEDTIRPNSPRPKSTTWRRCTASAPSIPRCGIPTAPGLRRWTTTARDRLCRQPASPATSSAATARCSVRQAACASRPPTWARSC